MDSAPSEELLEPNILLNSMVATYSRRTGILSSHSTYQEFITSQSSNISSPIYIQLCQLSPMHFEGHIISSWSTVMRLRSFTCASLLCDYSYWMCWSWFTLASSSLLASSSPLANSSPLDQHLLFSQLLPFDQLFPFWPALPLLTSSSPLDQLLPFGKLLPSKG